MLLKPYIKKQCHSEHPRAIERSAGMQGHPYDIVPERGYRGKEHGRLKFRYVMPNFLSKDCARQCTYDQQAMRLA